MINHGKRERDYACVGEGCTCVCEHTCVWGGGSRVRECTFWGEGSVYACAFGNGYIVAVCVCIFCCCFVSSTINNTK